MPAGRKSKAQDKKLAGKTTLKHRYDSFFEGSTGRGGKRDKVHNIRPGLEDRIHPQTARLFYRTNGFIQNIVDSPAEDSTREWIKVKTNRDDDKNVNKIILDELDRVESREAIRKLVSYSRLYNKGGAMFLGIKATAAQTATILKDPLPDQIRSLDYLNVMSESKFQIQVERDRPLHPGFGRAKRFQAQGQTVHPSRIFWLVNNYNEDDDIGVSIVQNILDAIKAQDSALWSANQFVFEMAIKVFKSPLVKDLNPSEIFEAVEDMSRVLSSQAMIGLADDETFEKVTGNIQGIKEVFDFIFENLAGLAKMPKSRIMGNAQGVITAGQYDIINYYESVRRFQNNQIKPIINKLISIVIKATKGKIVEAIGIEGANSLDWSFEFNPLWVPDPKEQSEIDNKNALTDQIYITTGVLTVEEVRNKRFNDLKEFDKNLGADLEKISSPLNLEAPPNPPEEAPKETPALA